MSTGCPKFLANFTTNQLRADAVKDKFVTKAKADTMSRKQLCDLFQKHSHERVRRLKRNMAIGAAVGASVITTGVAATIVASQMKARGKRQPK